MVLQTMIFHFIQRSKVTIIVGVASKWSRTCKSIYQTTTGGEILSNIVFQEGTPTLDQASTPIHVCKYSHKC
jgi:hypothetical protein